MVVIAISIAGDPGRIDGLFPGRIIVHQQGNDRSGARNKPGGVYPEIEIIFHVVHGALHTLTKPILKPAGVFIQPGGFGDAAIFEPEVAGPLSNPICMLATQQLVKFLSAGSIRLISNLSILVSFNPLH